MYSPQRGGRRRKRPRGEQLGSHHLGDARGSPLGDVLGHLQPAGAALVVVGRGARVALNERSQPNAIFAYELPGDVAAHRKADEHHRLANLQGVEQAGQVVGILLHRYPVVRIGVAERRLTEAPQIRSKDAPAVGQRVDLRRPHRVVEREAVHEQYRRARAAIDVSELDVLERGALHGTKANNKWGRG